MARFPLFTVPAIVVLFALVAGCDDNGPSDGWARLSGAVRVVGELRDASGIVLADSTIDDADGIPVRLELQTRAAPDSTTTSGGRFEFAGLPPGSYQASSWVDEGASVSTGWFTLDDQDLEFPDVIELGPLGVGSGATFEGCSPNPFSTSTDLRYTVSDAGPVLVVVRDLGLFVVATLVDATGPAGPHTVQWNGMTDAGVAPAGPYWICATMGGQTYADLVFKDDSPPGTLSGSVHLRGTLRDVSGAVVGDSTITDADSVPVHLESDVHGLGCRDRRQRRAHAGHRDGSRDRNDLDRLSAESLRGEQHVPVPCGGLRKRPARGEEPGAPDGAGGQRRERHCRHPRLDLGRQGRRRGCRSCGAVLGLPHGCRRDVRGADLQDLGVARRNEG